MSARKSLSPLFKWTGGKRREIKHFAPYYPDFVKQGQSFRFVEPFVGAGAVFWHLNNIEGENVINDFDGEVMNFYDAIARQDQETIRIIREVSSLFDVKDVDNREERAAAYYYQRNLDRDDGLAGLTDAERAARFFIVNQLAFSGMRRFNKKDEFNVPFGHYKNFNSSLLTNIDHTKLLHNTKLLNGCYRSVVESNDIPNTFMFLDPPYTRVMKKYSAGSEFGDEEQRQLAKILRRLENAHFMLVIDKSDLTMELYSDLVKHTYALNYGVNIRNRFSTAVEHIVVTNYPTSQEQGPRFRSSYS